MGAAYSERYTRPESPLLQEITDFTQAHRKDAQMLSGRVQGAFLSFISRTLRPERILEIGTFTGYSALCLAEGLGGTGRLHTLEKDPDNAAVSQAYFDRSPWREQITLHQGDALSILPDLKDTWDLVFIDADKVGYIHYYEWVVPRTRKGGVILADNVLFHGEVLDGAPKGKSAQAIQAFNERVEADDRVDNVLLTLRDGVMCIYVK